MRDANNRPLTGGYLRPSWVGFAVLCGLAAFLTFTGVYNAVNGLPFWLGWCYWMLTLVVGCLVGYGVMMACERLNAHYFAAYAVAIVVSTFAVTSVIITLQIIIGQPVPWAFSHYLFGQVLVISMLIFTVGLISEMPKMKALSEITEQDPMQHFLEHLPLKYRDAELYAISSEDHYLRVHTSKGEELILMRLSDAIHNLKNADGLQTHRSWWVATSAISDVKQDNGRLELNLKSGVSAPVSRTYKSALKTAKWF